MSRSLWLKISLIGEIHERFTPSSAVHFITSASFTEIFTVLPSVTSPAMRARASLVSRWRWRKPFSGRAGDGIVFFHGIGP